MHAHAASEWKSFLIFCVPATLNGILKNKYYIHAFLLVKSIRILLADSISKEGMQLAESMLMKFCTLMEQYYGTNTCHVVSR